MKSLKQLLFGKKYFAYLVFQSQGTFNFLKSVRIKPDKARITHKEKTYEIDVENPTFTKEGDNFYFIDIKKGQICFSTNEKTNSNQFEAMNDIIDKEIINQLTTDLIEKPSWSDRIIIAVMGLSIGLFIGYIFSDILGGFL